MFFGCAALHYNQRSLILFYGHDLFLAEDLLVLAFGHFFFKLSQVFLRRLLVFTIAFQLSQEELPVIPSFCENFAFDLG